MRRSTSTSLLWSGIRSRYPSIKNTSSDSYENVPKTLSKFTSQASNLNVNTRGLKYLSWKAYDNGDLPSNPRSFKYSKQVCAIHTSSAALAPQDYYEMLGLRKGASDQDIKRSYYQLAKKYHPDTNKDNADAAKKFQEVQKAYETLRDPEKRRIYDQVGPEGMENMEGRGFPGGGFPGGGFPGGGFPGAGGGFPNAGFGFGPEFFEQFFRADPNFSRIFNRVSLSPIKITFMDAVRGTRKRVSVPDMRGGSTNLDLDIPAGADDGTVIQAQVPAANGKTVMTVLIPIEIQPHPTFRREGNNVVSTVTLPFTKALLGTTIQVETVDQMVELTVPPCTRHNDRLRIRGKGFVLNSVRQSYKSASSSRGDHLIQINVSLPSRLSAKQRELLEDFEREEGIRPPKPTSATGNPSSSASTHTSSAPATESKASGAEKKVEEEPEQKWSGWRNPFSSFGFGKK
uniref:J domain-containing protein n=1 Tax=Polytomella parva TaxID=51329 RepID=A0A7S0YD63_9CHLO|mmetsp:Transcript_18935/g.34321  ORF Transcript_18935/g.34321 Transcript_18935/m.34321 type:complete len:457 (+) Transcript_18935:22-1392(+)